MSMCISGRRMVASEAEYHFHNHVCVLPNFSAHAHIIQNSISFLSPSLATMGPKSFWVLTLLLCCIIFFQQTCHLCGLMCREIVDNLIAVTSSFWPLCESFAWPTSYHIALSLACMWPSSISSLIANIIKVLLPIWDSCVWGLEIRRQNTRRKRIITNCHVLSISD